MNPENENVIDGEFVPSHISLLLFSQMKMSHSALTQTYRQVKEASSDITAPNVASCRSGCRRGAGKTLHRQRLETERVDSMAKSLKKLLLSSFGTLTLMSVSSWATEATVSQIVANPFGIRRPACHRLRHTPICPAKDLTPRE
jgi:hypothetical protein